MTQAVAGVMPHPACCFSTDTQKLCERIYYLPSREEKGSIPFLDLSAGVDLHTEGAALLQDIYSNLFHTTTMQNVFFLPLKYTNQSEEQTSWANYSPELNTKLPDFEYLELSLPWDMVS